MARGRALALNPSSQQLLALWAAKTGIALIAAQNIENPRASRVDVPIDHRAAIREHGRLGDPVWVGYVPWQGTPIITVGEAFVIDHDSRGLPFDAYGAVLAFARIAFYMVGFTKPLPPDQTINGRGHPSIRQFWPSTGATIAWPPGGPPATNMTLGALLNFVPLRKQRPKPSSGTSTENDYA